MALLSWSGTHKVVVPPKYGSPETGVGGFEAGWFGGQKRGG